MKKETERWHFSPPPIPVITVSLNRPQKKEKNKKNIQKENTVCGGRGGAKGTRPPSKKKKIAPPKPHN